MWRDQFGEWAYRIGTYQNVAQARVAEMPLCYVAQENTLHAAMDEARTVAPVVIQLRRQLPLAA